MDFQEIVITGINKKLFKQLKNKSKRHKKKILLLSYVDNINELMSISDVIVTKPGWITTAEALTKALPMIIVHPIPGQEQNNTAYLIEKGAALRLDNPKDLNLTVEALLNDKDKLKKLSESAARISKPNAAIDAAQLLLSLCK